MWFAAVLAGIIIVSAGLWFGYEKWNQKQLAAIQDRVAEAFVTRDWNAALQATSDWTSKQPSSGEAWARHANALARLGRHQEAYNALEKINREFLRYSEILELKANIQLRELHNPFGCLTVCRELIQIEPSSPAAHHFLVYIRVMLRDVGQLETALHDAMNAGADSPGMYAYLMMLEDLTVQDGFEVTEKWLEHNPHEPRLLAANAVYRLKIAELARVRDNSEEAQQRVKDAETLLIAEQQKHPRNAVLRESVIELHRAEGRTEKWQRLLATCPEDQRSRATIQRAFAALKMQQNQTEQAIQILTSLIKKRPLSYETQGLLSEALRASGDLSGSEKQSSIAAEGARLREAVRNLKSVDDVTPKLLQQIQKHALTCEAWAVANALSRRLGLPPTE